MAGEEVAVASVMLGWHVVDSEFDLYAVGTFAFAQTHTHTANVA